MFDAERLMDAYLYLVWVGLLFHATLIGLAAVALIPIFFRHGGLGYMRSLGRVVLFNALLLACGALGNHIWMAFVNDRLYVSQDTVVDFYPFLPFGQWALDVEFGGESGRLLGATQLWQLKVLWALLAAGVWALTVLLYRRPGMRARRA